MVLPDDEPLLDSVFEEVVKKVSNVVGKSVVEA